MSRTKKRDCLIAIPLGKNNEKVRGKVNLSDLDLIIEKVESIQVDVDRLTQEKNERLETEFLNARQSVHLLKRDLSDIRFALSEKAE